MVATRVLVSAGVALAVTATAFFCIGWFTGPGDDDDDNNNSGGGSVSATDEQVAKLVKT
jgi:hypothetical protein